MGAPAGGAQAPWTEEAGSRVTHLCYPEPSWHRCAPDQDRVPCPPGLGHSRRGGDPSARLGEWRTGPLCPDPGPCRLQGLPCLLWCWIAGQPAQAWLLRVGHGLGVEALERPIYDPGLGGSLLTGNPTISTRGIWAASFPASCLGWPEVAGRQTPDPVAFGAGEGAFLA